jgi:hypothetical protein
MATSAQVRDNYQNLLEDLRISAAEKGSPLSARFSHRKDDETMLILRIQSTELGVFTFYADATLLPKEDFEARYIDIIGTRLQLLEDAKLAMHNAAENFASLRAAMGNYSP